MNNIDPKDLIPIRPITLKAKKDGKWVDTHYAEVRERQRIFRQHPDYKGFRLITDWVEKGKGNIFINNNASVQDSLKPILSLFIDLMARKILSMPDYTMQKTVFLLDEFTTLQKLPSLINLLTL